MRELRNFVFATRELNYLQQISQDFTTIMKIYLENVGERLFIDPQEPTQFTHTDRIWLRNVAENRNLSE